jgi:hypothetical protein
VLGLSAGMVCANAPNEYDEGVLVPYALFRSSGETTVVTLANRDPGTVYWAFFDADGARRFGGSFVMPVGGGNRLFVLNAQAAAAGASALAGSAGSLLFALDRDGNGLIDDDDGNHLSGNAVQAQTPDGPFLGLPTLDVNSIGLRDPDPAAWTESAVAVLDTTEGKVGDPGASLDLQYLIDGRPGGDDTKLYLWSTRPLPTELAARVHNGAGEGTDVTLSLARRQLNEVDLEGVSGIGPEFVGHGLLRWNVPAVEGSVQQVFMFGILSRGDEPLLLSGQFRD